VTINAEQRATLGAGEYFGEIALLMDTPRTATVAAIQPTILLELSADDFKTLVRDSSAVKQALERASSRRALSNERWDRQGHGRRLTPVSQDAPG
jgi:CRP-like cAMP-binding protein